MNPNEWVEIVFDLTGGGTYADVEAELTNGSLRIGIHVQGFAGGGSESLIHIAVPEPGTLAFLALGLATLARRRA